MYRMVYKSTLKTGGCHFFSLLIWVVARIGKWTTVQYYEVHVVFCMVQGSISESTSVFLLWVITCNLRLSGGSVYISRQQTFGWVHDALLSLFYVGEQWGSEWQLLVCIGEQEAFSPPTSSPRCCCAYSSSLAVNSKPIWDEVRNRMKYRTMKQQQLLRKWIFARLLRLFMHWNYIAMSFIIVL